MTVRSQKTAAHDGHAVRVVPMTPELRPILQTLLDQAPEGSPLMAAKHYLQTPDAQAAPIRATA